MIRIENLTFIRTHIPVEGRRELVPVVMIIVEPDLLPAMESDEIIPGISFEKAVHNDKPLLIMSISLHFPDSRQLTRSHTIDYFDDSTLGFFEDVFSGRPFLFGFASQAFIEGKEKQFFQKPAYINETLSGEFMTLKKELTDYRYSHEEHEYNHIITAMNNWWQTIGQPLNAQTNQLEVND